MSRSFLELSHVVAPILGLTMLCLAHAAFCRWRRNSEGLNGLVWAGWAGALGVALVEFFLWFRGVPLSGVLASALLVDFPVYALLAYGYANFFNLGESSVRVRIYRELVQAGGRGLDRRDLLERYDEEAMFRARLVRLVAAGDLEETGGRYRLGQMRLLWVARIIFALQRMVLGRAG